MNKTTKKIILNTIKQFRFATMSTEELVDRIEAAENERQTKRLKELQRLDSETRKRKQK